MIDSFAAPHLLQYAAFLLAKFRRDDDRNGLSDYLVWLVAEDASSASIPGKNTAIERLADDCIVRGGYNGREECQLDRMVRHFGIGR